MSRDQKPGKIRVIGTSEAAAGAPPQRRATDVDPNALEGTAADRKMLETAPAVQTGGLAFVPVLLFLLCCASGGIACTLLVLPSLPQ